MVRTATVKNTKRSVVADYLPANYRAYGIGRDGRDVLIVGEDDHGWTLDGYVIPRLASGLIVAIEEVVLRDEEAFPGGVKCIHGTLRDVPCPPCEGDARGDWEYDRRGNR